MRSPARRCRAGAELGLACSCRAGNRCLKGRRYPSGAVLEAFTILHHPSPPFTSLHHPIPPFTILHHIAPPFTTLPHPSHPRRVLDSTPPRGDQVKRRRTSFCMLFEARLDSFLARGHISQDTGVLDQYTFHMFTARRCAAFSTPRAPITFL